MGRFERRRKELFDPQPSRSNRIIHIVDLGTTIGKDYVKLIIIYCLCYGFRECSVLNLVSKKWYNYLKDDSLWKSICDLKWGYVYENHLQLPVIDNEEISIRSWRLFYELWDGRRNWCHSFSRLISANAAFDYPIICKEAKKEARTLFDNKLKPLYWCLTRSSNVLTKYNIFMDYKDLKSYLKYPSFSREMLFIDTLQLKFVPLDPLSLIKVTCVSTKNKEHLSLYSFHVLLNPLMVEFGNGNEEVVTIKFVDDHDTPISFQENRDKLKLFALEIGWKEDRKDLESLYQMLREMFEQVWIYVKKSFYTY